MKYNIRPGDVGLTINKGFVPRAIGFFMNMYRKALKLPERTLYNHAFTVVNVWGTLNAAEALNKGFTIRPLSVYLDNKGQLKSTVKIRIPKAPYSIREQETISKEATLLTFSPTRYDFMNFLYQLRMIVKMYFTKGSAKWKGPTGAKAAKRLYCSESVAVLANKIRPETFKESASTNPLDIDISNKYVDIDKADNRSINTTDVLKVEKLDPKDDLNVVMYNKPKNDNKASSNKKASKKV